MSSDKINFFVLGASMHVTGEHFVTVLLERTDVQDECKSSSQEFLAACGYPRCPRVFGATVVLFDSQNTAVMRSIAQC